jgi:anti-anti-sigma regulatory factor
MLRHDGPTTVVEVHGELLAAGLTEFDRLCEVDDNLVVDLSNVRHLDSAATIRLREMSSGNVRLVEAPRFIHMMIAGGDA